MSNKKIKVTRKKFIIDKNGNLIDPEDIDDNHQLKPLADWVDELSTDNLSVKQILSQGNRALEFFKEDKDGDSTMFEEYIENIKNEVKSNEVFEDWYPMLHFSKDGPKNFEVIVANCNNSNSFFILWASRLRRDAP